MLDQGIARYADTLTIEVDEGVGDRADSTSD
jgi:hypothetical protein